MTNSIFEKITYRSTSKSPTCLDLFSGAGGLSVGFLMAGGRPLGAIDIDKDSIETYRRLFPKAVDIACGDIEHWQPKSTSREIDLIIGGPPCQGFSLARGLRFVDDPRNHLYKNFVRLVSRYKPSWFVMENVEGITNIGGGVILRQILEDFDRIGYQVDYQVVNMAEYGVPQLRKRAVFVGNRKKCHFIWPVKKFYDSRKKGVTHERDLFSADLLPFHSVNSALSDLYLPSGNYFAHRANSQMRGPRNRNAHTEPAFTLRVRGDEFALCEKPATSAFIPGPAPENDIVYLKAQNELQDILREPVPSWARRPSSKIRTSGGIPSLEGTRRLSIREQARLQTFPDWVEFSGRTTSQARQIGNAVPPLFAYQLFRKIFEFL
jgi:DNA (cytosine-5)-methyltransferase 1